MNIDEIRQSFLAFFEEKKHTVIPSSSLVPYSDPTLLFTSAGMVQIKPYFLGTETPPNNRLASCQKCFRTTDIESVGDTKHLTFFEMLGNFSVGDYFKNEAIAWAWEYITRRLKLSPDRLWITVYTDDDEALEIWHRTIGVPLERIMRFGEKDNFWGPAGSSGPCGPCSELHYDFGEQYGCGRKDCNPGCDCGRFVEIWNLVFTQYNQDEAGLRTPLPRPNIDTGMGLERIAAVIQGKSTVYDTDVFAPLLQKLALFTGRKYGVDPEADNAMRVIVEHSRAIAFLLADGVMPANDGRGYVLRRLIRRAALFGKKLGLENLFLKETCADSIDRMKKVYPELEHRRDVILKVADLEESRFHETLNTGLTLLDGLISSDSSRVRNTVPGEDVFRLYDTYGFPVELTREMAARAGLAVDMEGFNKEMEKQKERARSSHKFDIARGNGKMEIRPGIAGSLFVGYDRLKFSSRINEILVEGKSVDEVPEGLEAGIILESTPFYGEMGGQVGDTGIISNSGGRFAVTNTIHMADWVIHQGRIESGRFAVGEEVEAEVDLSRRMDIAANHTATHLLQYALREVLGPHVQQRGSMVGPSEFRFDFSHLTAMTPGEIRRVQSIVNDKIRQNLAVKAEQMAYKQAVSGGATALFDEKYGDIVRVVKIGSPAVSAELCGGTHVSATGQIGFFQVVNESSIGSGLRRIEAMTGRGAENLVEQKLDVLERIARALGTSPDGAKDKVEMLLNDLEAERKKIAGLQKEVSRKNAGDLLDRIEEVNGIKLLAAGLTDVKLDSLREMADVLREKMGSGVIVLASVCDDKPSFIAMVTPDLVQKGYHAGEIVKKVAQVTGGGGGGKPGMAQAGGKDSTRVEEALHLARTLIKG
ncbi:MAG: alanine--tRNA ligase [Dehalococcoidales bacterium]|nr:alanine--tRNA ligase [Dehalococcoidales bacterium]